MDCVKYKNSNVMTITMNELEKMLCKGGRKLAPGVTERELTSRKGVYRYWLKKNHRGPIFI